MPNRLFPPLCLLLFFPAGVAFCAEIWPLVMRRPVPRELGEDLLLLGLVALLLTGLVTSLLMVNEERRRVHR
ncbi:hypothetical protein [Methylobacterium iners]|uniref:Uncharacterized protein n=1 Tax=Methylobacterium iners TaxID=418707 RepID=A0ABQ4S2I3_9HYPH|nr:hypothetical protein [Methylobacterium iners]GJD97340.1 hypothetical protein OCOJLMKI_4569 [Methylobacterium iners]